MLSLSEDDFNLANSIISGEICEEDDKLKEVYLSYVLNKRYSNLSPSYWSQDFGNPYKYDEIKKIEVIKSLKDFVLNYKIFDTTKLKETQSKS